MRPGDAFIEVFNQIEDALRHKAGVEEYVPFSRLVDIVGESDPVVGNNQQLLKALGDLRNAIVHHEEYPSKILADPRPEVVRAAENLLEKIKNPQKLIPTFQKEIRVFQLDDSLNSCLDFMNDNDYSQVVVQDSEGYRVLSAEGIVGWLRSASGIGLADLENATVGDCMPFEDERACRYLARNEPVELAIDEFAGAIRQGIPRLQAILVTERGRKNEKPLGIITSWDLLDLER